MLEKLRESQLFNHFLMFMDRFFIGLLFAIIGAGFLGKVIGMTPTQISSRIGENGLFFVLILIISVFIVWALDFIRGD